jgi:hypothetical protein
MGIRKVLVSLVAGAVLTAHLGAQAKPSYAGRWTSDPDPAAAAEGPQRGGGGGRGGGRGDMGSGWGANFTITQDASRMTVEIPFFSRGDMQPPLRFAYALDGSETKNTVMMGRGIQAETSKAAWEGEKLTITTMHQIQNPADGKPMAMEVRRTLSLEAASLVVETLRKGILGGPDTTTRIVYRRVGG